MHDLRDGHTCAGFDDEVEINEREFEIPREDPADGGFTCPRRTIEEDVRHRKEVVSEQLSVHL